MSRINIAAFAAVAFALLTGACSEKVEITTPAPVASAQPAATPAPQPAVAAPVVPIKVTDVQIDTCADAIMANPAYGLNDRSVRRIRAGQKYLFGTIEVTVTDHGGIWNGCKAALSDPLKTRLAAVQAEDASLSTAIAAMDTEFTALQTRLNKARTDQTQAKAAIQQLQRDISARDAASARATTPAPASQQRAAPAPQAGQQPAQPRSPTKS